MYKTISRKALKTWTKKRSKYVYWRTFEFVINVKKRNMYKHRHRTLCEGDFHVVSIGSQTRRLYGDCKNGARGTKSQKSAHVNAQKDINGDLKGCQTIKRAEEMWEKKNEEMEEKWRKIQSDEGKVKRGGDRRPPCEKTTIEIMEIRGNAKKTELALSSSLVSWKQIFLLCRFFSDFNVPFCFMNSKPTILDHLTTIFTIWMAAEEKFPFNIKCLLPETNFCKMPSDKKLLRNHYYISIILICFFTLIK